MPSRTDKRTDRASTVQPGDGPADTTEPAEVVTSVTPNKAAAATAGEQTVNAVVPVPAPETLTQPTSPDRVETYEAERPDGTRVLVTHNIDTGETTTSEL